MPGEGDLPLVRFNRQQVEVFLHQRVAVHADSKCRAIEVRLCSEGRLCAWSVFPIRFEVTVIRILRLMSCNYRLIVYVLRRCVSDAAYCWVHYGFSLHLFSTYLREGFVCMVRGREEVFVLAARCIRAFSYTYILAAQTHACGGWCRGRELLTFCSGDRQLCVARYLTSRVRLAGSGRVP